MPAFVKLTDITCQATLCWVPIVANSYTLFSCYICHNVFILLLIRIESDAYFSSAFRQSCAWLNLNVPVFVWVCLLHIISWLILAFSNRSNNFQAFGNRKDLEQGFRFNWHWKAPLGKWSINVCMYVCRASVFVTESDWFFCGRIVVYAFLSVYARHPFKW